ncbi:uncharacterized protein LOC135623686 [Musa acuminata AAA Group]|uniref:uncharacterized protein LOC135623686 n=1 Tax=Musa acuminata AAA Group TaxID=214697 RepID=UPI0031DE1CCB
MVPLSPSQRDKTIIFVRSSRGGSFWEPAYPHFGTWSEYDTVGTSVKAAIVYLGTALVKLICLATFLKVPENDNFDPYQELLKALIGFIDVARLYFALAQLTHRNISQNHKFQAVGLDDGHVFYNFHQ